MAGQPGWNDLQGEGAVALGEQGPCGGGELLGPAAGQQVERGGLLGRVDGLQSLPVWLPVTGALVVEPLGEVVADHQVRARRPQGARGALPGEAGLQQHGQGQPAADAVQHLPQLGQRRPQAGDRLGGEQLGQRGVAVDEQAGAACCR